MSHVGLEKVRRYNQKSVNLFKIFSKILHGIWVIIQMLAKDDTHKKMISSGVKIKFAKGLIIDMGIPHTIKRGKDIKEITNCNSKKEMM